VSTDFLALRLFCFNICQHGRQILYFKLGLHVDGRKFHYRRPQVVHRWFSGQVRTQGGVGVKPPLEFAMLQKRHYLC